MALLFVCALPAFAAEDAKPKSPTEEIAETTTAVRKAVVDALSVFIVGVFVISVVREMLSNSIIIEPISVPESLSKDGYTPQVVAERIRSEIAALRRAARIRGREEGFELSASLIDFTVPAAGVSYRTALRYIRQVFGRSEERISGEIVLDSPASDAPKRLRIILRTRTGAMVSSDVRVTHDVGISGLIEQAAYDIVMLTDPYTIATYWLSYEQNEPPFHTTIHAVRRCLAMPNARNDARAYWIWGNALLFSRDFEQAETKFRAAAAISPYRPSIYSSWGNMRRQQRRYDDAEALYFVALATDSRNVAVWNNLGNINADRHRYDDAIRCYRRATQLDPRYAHAWNGWGNTLVRMYRWKEAEEKFVRAIDLEPSLGFPQLNLARLRRAQGRFGEALAIAEQVTRIPSMKADAFMLQGDILLDLRDLDGAEAIYEKAHAAKPKEGFDHIGRAVILRERRQWPEAVAEAELALKANQYNTNARHLAAEALRRGGRFAAACATFRQVLNSDPYNVNARIALAQTLRSRHRYGEVIEELKKATALDPFEPWGWRSWGEVLLDLHSPGSAIEKFQRANELTDDMAAAHGSWAKALAVRGEVEEAQQRARHGCDVETAHNSWCWRVLADVTLDAGMEAAIAVIDEGLAKWPASVELAKHKAEILRVYEQTSDATVAYDRAVTIDARYADTLISASAMLLDNGLTQEAIEVAKRAVDFDPWSDNAYAALGWAHFRAGHVAEAEKILAAATESTYRMTTLGAGLRDHGRAEDALRQYEQVAALDPANADVHVRIGHIARERGDQRQARERFMRATSIDPFNGWAWRSRGDAVIDADPAQAEECYATAARLNRRDVRVAVGLSRVASLREQRSRAVSIVCKAFADARNSSDFQVLTDRLIALKEFDAALAELELALQARPEWRQLIGLSVGVLRAAKRPADAEQAQEAASLLRDRERAQLQAWTQQLLSRTAIS